MGHAILQRMAYVGILQGTGSSRRRHSGAYPLYHSAAFAKILRRARGLIDGSAGFAERNGDTLRGSEYKRFSTGPKLNAPDEADVVEQASADCIRGCAQGKADAASVQ